MQNERTQNRIVAFLSDAILIAYFIFALFPLVWMVLVSLKSGPELFTTKFIFTPTIENYVAILFGDARAAAVQARLVNDLLAADERHALTQVILIRAHDVDSLDAGQLPERVQIAGVHVGHADTVDEVGETEQNFAVLGRLGRDRGLGGLERGDLVRLELFVYFRRALRLLRNVDLGERWGIHLDQDVDLLARCRANAGRGAEVSAGGSISGNVGATRRAALPQPIPLGDSDQAHSEQ